MVKSLGLLSIVLAACLVTAVPVTPIKREPASDEFVTFGELEKRTSSDGNADQVKIPIKRDIKRDVKRDAISDKFVTFGALKKRAGSEKDFDLFGKLYTRDNGGKTNNGGDESFAY